jgi:Family of unknown function (DUF6267)
VRAFEFLTEAWSKKYKSSINCSNPKGFSQKAHCAGRKKNESVNEDETPAPKKVGREFNHLEDLVFTEPNGAVKAIEILKSLARPETSITIKWDGNPTVYWGRDEDGTFRMVGKNNWGREEGKSASPEDLKQFIMSRGKGEDWREKFASDMAALWPVFEKATPKDFRGYVYGDILFHPGKPYQGADGRISFTPNQTTYAVLGNSDIGRSLAKAKIAVAAHKQFGYFGDKTGEDFDNPEIFASNPELKVFGLTTVSTRSAVSADNLGRIQALAKNQQAINKLLAPVAGMGYLQNEIYTFVNTQSKAKQLDNINTDAFMAFVGKTPVKAAKIAAHSETHPGVMDTMFALVKEIMAAKDEVIRELDAAEGDITATTGGKPGGEGYVAGGSKLVPRDRWTPFRAD